VAKVPSKRLRRPKKSKPIKIWRNTPPPREILTRFCEIPHHIWHAANAATHYICTFFAAHRAAHEDFSTWRAIFYCAFAPLPHCANNAKSRASQAVFRLDSCGKNAPNEVTRHGILPQRGAHKLVRSRGLEPPRVSPLPPQGSASTNSATTARRFVKRGA
jgi:hypothetical protein